MYNQKHATNMSPPTAALVTLRDRGKSFIRPIAEISNVEQFASFHLVVRTTNEEKS